MQFSVLTVLVRSLVVLILTDCALQRFAGAVAQSSHVSAAFCGIVYAVACPAILFKVACCKAEQLSG
jgi:hypothetical protein